MRKVFKWLKKCFVPHAENNFKPHFLRHESFFLFFSLIIIIELGFLVQVFIVFDKTEFLASVLPGVLTSITNDERAENNLSPLTPNELLQRAAQLKAEDMATKGYFAHTSPEGKTPWSWLDQVGYKYIYAGENLAVNFFESEDVAEAWMNSPTHKANIIKPNYTEIGVGVANGMYEGRNTVFVTQFFGTPAVVATTTPPPVPATTPAPEPAPTEVVVTPEPTSTEVLGEEVIETGQFEENVEDSLIRSTKESPIKLTIEKTLTSPRRSVAYAYGGIALLSMLAVFFVIFIRSELKHPYMIARGAGLVAIVLLLSFINLKMLGLEPQVPVGNMGANVMEALPR